MNKHLPTTIYLDYMASTPIDPKVSHKMFEILTQEGLFANPSSQHHFGWQVKELIEEARVKVARAINAHVNEIIWTSGATEAINMALKGVALSYQRQGKHIISCTTEHKAVLETLHYLERQGFELSLIKPKVNGLIDLEELEEQIRDDTILISLSHVNNEIGVIQDIANISKITRSKGIVFHLDAAQSMGKIELDVEKLGIDLMSLSAHKAYGPKGIGALYIRNKPKIHLVPLIHGGGQEQKLRSGTLATHQIVGMGEAFMLAQSLWQEEYKRISKLQQELLHGISILPGIKINGCASQRVPHNLNVSFAGVEGETLILALNNIALSNGAACTAATMSPSHVLKAIGIETNLAYSSLRFSLGRFTTEQEIKIATRTVVECVTKLRQISPIWSNS